MHRRSTKMVIFTAFTLATTGIVSQAEQAPPAELSERIAQLNSDCASMGGKDFQHDDGFVVSAEFNGDGRTDYLLNLNHGYCSSAMSAFSGAAGAAIDVLLSQPDGSLQLSKSWTAPDARVDATLSPNTIELTAVNRGGDTETVVWAWKLGAWELVAIRPATQNAH